MATKIISRSFSSLFDNSMFSTEEVEPEELRCFYMDLFQPEYYIKARITGTKTMETLDERYTVYVIQVRLPFPFNEYIIEKRYTQFLELYRKIERNYKNSGLGRTAFPSKRFFGSFDDETIQHRKILLDRFIALLSETYKQDQKTEFLEFLEIRKRIEMLVRLPGAEQTVSLKSSQGEEYTNDMDQVTHFLGIFNRNTIDFCRTFKDFEKFFFENKPRFSKNAIKKLFYGDGNLEGLIHLCGKYDSCLDSHLTCGAGMHLLSKMLDYEYNRDAESYNQVFGSTNLRDIMCLYFDRHIQVKGFRPCKVATMKLLNCFMNYNPSIALNQLLTEDESIQEFEMWKTSQHTTSIKAENFFKHRDADLY